MVPTLTDGRIVTAASKRSCKARIALLVLVSTALCSSAFANEFPAIIPLSSLDGSIGFRLDGVAAGDKSGYTVASAGDVNGDGLGDVIIGAFSADPHGSYSGSSYVVFGKASGFTSTFDLSSLNGSNGFRLDGVAVYDISGLSVAAAGDVNGDGFGDVIIGAFRANPHGSYSGSSYVVFGKGSGFTSTFALSSLNGSNGFRLDGVAAFDNSGFSVASAGDFNGDSFGDVIIAAPYFDSRGNSGSSYVVFGKASGFTSTFALSSLNGSNGFRIDSVSADGSMGMTVAAAGDVNGDGFGDVIIGAPYIDLHGIDSGSGYVVFGKGSGFTSTFALSSLNGSNGFRLDGTDSNNRCGFSVAAAGDVNGDGFGDVIIGAPGYDPDFYSSGPGSSYVVFGKASGFTSIINLYDHGNGFRLDGAGSRANSGRSVAAAGDVNGDGFGDVIIGSDASSHVVFGPGFTSVIDLASLDGSTGFRLDRVAAYDGSGRSVAAAGDVNGDGFGDVIVGAGYANPHGDASGSSYVLFGRAPDHPVTRVGAAADQYISGGPFADTLSPAAGFDRVEGRGGADNLQGGPGNDTATYLHAPHGMIASLSNPDINTGHAAGDRYTSIENLAGSQFADRLIGNGLANRLIGRGGKDRLTGGAGPDTFVLFKPSDSSPGLARDVIADFNAGTVTTFVDRIGLGHIDANTQIGGHQKFTFIGTQAFSHVPGQLRVHVSGTTTIVSGDVNGDAKADFEIGLLNFTNLDTLTAKDFVL